MTNTNRIHVTLHNSDHKMAGFQSVSTSVLDNPYCQARRKCGDSVCAKCYADHLCKYRKTLQNCLKNNYELLTAELLPDNILLKADIYTRYARIEAFGDVANVTHARNYTRLIKLNPETNFGIWSKNHGIWAKAFQLEGKPENCTYVFSSVKVNEIGKIPDCIKPYVDHVFTVWDKERYTFAGTPSECAGIQCKTCLKCYKKNTEFFINEKLR